MISVEEAQRLVVEQASSLPPRAVPLEESLGLILAEAVASDVDSPPHDKAMVDGYAIRTADLANGAARLAIIEEVMAGDVPLRMLGRGEATRIMTGSPIPTGCDAVVMFERTDVVDVAGDALGTVVIRDAPMRPGANILKQGCSMRRGDVALEAGCEIRPIEIGLLAEMGRSTVETMPRPRVAILSTGNELVPPEQVPARGQIRNSNGPLLAAAVARAGGIAEPLGICRDESPALRGVISAGLRSNILVLSGGVSAGVLDLVPAVLSELGVRCVFHKVRLKPGKPLWFGVYCAGAANCLVFGLPGNPVSSLVCFELFVRPVMARLAGRMDIFPPRKQALLSRAFTHRGDRPTYHPAHLADDEGGVHVDPLKWHGSADLRALAAANALIHFASGDRQWMPGESLDVLPL